MLEQFLLKDSSQIFARLLQTQVVDRCYIRLHIVNVMFAFLNWITDLSHMPSLASDHTVHRGSEFEMTDLWVLIFGEKAGAGRLGEFVQFIIVRPSDEIRSHSPKLRCDFLVRCDPI